IDRPSRDRQRAVFRTAGALPLPDGRGSVSRRATEEYAMARRHTNSMVMATFSFVMAWVPIQAHALEPAGTRLLATPAITEGKIAFVYADDIRVADSDGKHPRRLTAHPGAEQNPSFSPDGRHVAFTASYDGNEDVYVIPTAGGEPARLTWHPG